MGNGALAGMQAGDQDAGESTAQVTPRFLNEVPSS
jgi:hypothetical protein